MKRRNEKKMAWKINNNGYQSKERKMSMANINVKMAKIMA